MSEWMPVETAPRDGTTIIGGFFNMPWADSHKNGDICKCWFQPEFDAFISSCRQMVLRSDLKFDDGSQARLHSPEIENITHWMPYPTPPEKNA